MKRSISSVVLAILIVTVAVSLSQCGGGGDGGVSEDNNIAWININYSSVDLYADGLIKARIGGDAFISKDYVAHHCVGLACWFTWFDDSYPGVNVTWANLTTGEQGAAISKYGTITDWRHAWYANVPVVYGINQLEAAAADPAGNSATASISVESIPLPPYDFRADSGDGQITLLWSPVEGVTNYRVYWSTIPGTAYPYGAAIDVKDSPYTHIGLANGTTYYYVITSFYQTSQSDPSDEIVVTAGTPSQPENLSASLVSIDIILSWNDAYLADTYTLYWANEPGVSKESGNAINGAISPYLHTSLSGIPYYYVVTAVNGFGESLESEEAMAFPPQAPPAPSNLSVSQREGVTGYPQVVDLFWDTVPGASYKIYRRFCGYVQLSGPEDCTSAIVYIACRTDLLEYIGNATDPNFSDWTVLVNTSDCGRTIYQYQVSAVNDYGESQLSETVSICVAPEAGDQC